MPGPGVHTSTSRLLLLLLLLLPPLQVQQQVLDGLKRGNTALEKANAVFSIDEIESIMSDTVSTIQSQPLYPLPFTGGGSREAARDREDAVRRSLRGGSHNIGSHNLGSHNLGSHNLNITIYTTQLSPAIYSICRSIAL